MPQVREMTVGNPFPQILQFAVPLILGNELQQLYSLVDATIVGQALGVGPLAAVGASSSVLFLILGFCGGCAGGFGIPVAQRFGARDYQAMRRYVANALRLTAALSVVLAIVTSMMCDTILSWMHTPADIMDDAYWYLLVTFVGIPATFYYNLLASIIRALGDSRTPFWFLLLSTVLNILLDFVAILLFGWGVAGAAIATIVAQLSSGVACHVYMVRHFQVLRFQGSESRWRWAECRRLLALGVPMGLQFSITAVGSMMLQAANNALGTACVAAFTAAMRIKMFCMTPLESLGMAMATYCGQNVGAGRADRIGQGIAAAFRMMVPYCVAMAMLLWSVSPWLALLFVAPTDVEIIRHIVTFNHINVSFYVLLGSLIILRYSIQGMGHTRLAMLSGVMEMVARGVWAVAIVPLAGYVGVCYGDPVAWLSACLFLVPAFWWVNRWSRRQHAARR